MIQWKQRAYAFLLRRALGPYLTAESLVQLHECIDVSLQEGKFTLRNVHLRLDQLNRLLTRASEEGGRPRAPVVAFRRAHVGMLEIVLTLLENGGSDGDNDDGTSGSAVGEQGRSTATLAPSSSIAWRAMQFGSTPGVKVSLLASVTIDGLHVELAPCDAVSEFDLNEPMPTTPLEQQTAEEGQSKVSTTSSGVSTASAMMGSVVSSYLDAALASLRLSVQLRNFHVRVYDGGDGKEVPGRWLEVRLLSASYRDDAAEVERQQQQSSAAGWRPSHLERSPSASSPLPPSTYETVVNKVVEFTRITVVVGNDAEGTESTTIALLDGGSTPGKVALRVVEYRDAEMPPTDDSPPPYRPSKRRRKVQQDIQVQLNQRLNVTMDEANVLQVYSIVRHLLSASTSTSRDSKVVPAMKASPTSDDTTTDLDKTDLRTIHGMMNEYQKARLLAEQNHFRGGILLPSVDDDALDVDDENDSPVTFEAFFDANEHSVARLSTILRESVIMDGPGAADDSQLAAFVHTKLYLHLTDGCIKVAFGPRQGADRPRRRADEYLLLSLTEVSATSSISRARSEHALSIAMIDLEDSQLIDEDRSRSADATARRVDIGTVLKFSPALNEISDSLGSQSGVIVAPPCLTVLVRTEFEGDGVSSEVDVSLEPMELTVRDRTIANASVFAESCLRSLSDGSKPSHDTDENRSRHSKLYYLSCPELTFFVPAQVESAWMELYHRRGYSVDAWISKSALCMCLSGLTIEASNRVDAPTTALAFHSATAYVQSPNDAADGTAHRFDIVCISGRTEVDPIIGVSFKLWKTDGKQNKAEQLFPKVPAVRSFKARQEDEEDDKRVDQMLSSYAKEFDLGSKRCNLRGIDPQADMLAAASSCSSVLEIHVPEIVTDLSCEELCTLLSISKLFESKMSIQKPSSETEPPQHLGVVVTCDLLLLEILSPCCRDNEANSTFLIQMEVLQTHLLRQGTHVRQMRLLVHDIGLLHVPRPASEATIVPPSNVRAAFRRRMESVKSLHSSILLHRTSLFPAISYQSPVILLDMVDTSTSPDNNQVEASKQSNLYVTVYDLTYRLDYDNAVLDRMKSLLEALSRTGAREPEPSSLHRSEFHVTRFFFTVVDCNCDYSSSVNFTTPSRLILRVGDARVSSNIVTPKPAVQAVSAALGDVVLYVAKSRFPYAYENAQFNWLYLTSASMPEYDGGASASGGKECGDSVQRAMGLTTVALLDTLDAVVTSTYSPGSVDPKLQVNLTIGEVGIFAAKDSFARFISSLSELAADVTALDASALEQLRAKAYLKSVEAEEVRSSSSENDSDVPFQSLEDLKRQSALRPTAGTSRSVFENNDFLLDGYDWTTIDQGSHRSTGVPSGEEQSARWYTESPSLDQTQREQDGEEISFLPSFVTPEKLSSSPTGQKGPQIISHHFPFHLVSDPLIDNDKELAKFAGTPTPPTVRSRVVVHDLRFRIRLFDGYDWPELLEKTRRPALGKGAFVIDMLVAPEPEDPQKKSAATTETPKPSRKSALLNELLVTASETSGTFRDTPLPEDRGAQLREQAELQRLKRRPGRYFQLSGSGVSLRVDSLEESTDHRLASVLNLKLQDFFLAETISSDRPIKFAGEWVNDLEHPRDSKDGLFAVKMVSWHPITRVTPNNEIVSDEAEIAFRMLPLRCMIDQKAIRFIRAFFRSDENGTPSGSNEQNDPRGTASSVSSESKTSRKVYSIPPPLFRSYRFLQFKLKVDYRPEKLDAAAIYNGALVELINLSPIDGLVLTLQQVRGEDQVGFGAVASAVVSHWLQDVCATQLHKFVTSARAVDPFANVGSAAVDMVVLPWEAIQNGDSIRRALRAGTTAFASTVVTETLSVGSRLTKFMADQVARRATPSLGMNVLPSRPLDAPRDLRDATPHVVETLTRGLQAANYTVVIVPYREYRRRGAAGAISSALRGIPVAIAAPASGAAEALSYAAIGVRNQVRPDLRREEEASLRGLHSDAAGRR